MPGIDAARELVNRASRILAFTGAGISTESGIPDFRSPGGVWATNRTVVFDAFVRNRDDRIEYWRQKAAIWPEMRDAKPNDGHLAFQKLQSEGRLLAMITQNIDGLFQKAGMPPRKIIELHGTTVDVACLSCGDLTTMDSACRRIREGDPAPQCLKCRGLLKPNTISFGQSLDADVLHRAEQLCEECDLLIAAGSSLIVQPAAGIPVLARQHGASLIIINRDPTPLDDLADEVIREPAGSTLSLLAAS
jgi:NAD-dependent deacetylase